MEELLQVGVISSTHGIKGEVKVFPTTDDPNRYKKLKEVILDTGKEQIVLKIEGIKFFKKFVILKFIDIDDINQIEKYKGNGLFVTRENAVPLKDNEYFIADLIGLTILDEESKEYGILRDVLQTGANDVYVIDINTGGEVLVPAIKECILDVNLLEKTMRIHLLEGLLD